MRCANATHLRQCATAKNDILFSTEGHFWKYFRNLKWKKEYEKENYGVADGSAYACMLRDPGYGKGENY